MVQQELMLFASSLYIQHSHNEAPKHEVLVAAWLFHEPHLKSVGDLYVLHGLDHVFNAGFEFAYCRRVIGDCHAGFPRAFALVGVLDSIVGYLCPRGIFARETVALRDFIGSYLILVDVGVVVCQLGFGGSV